MMEALIDFLGALPFLTLMNARARRLIVEPRRADAVTRSVCTNGARRSLLTTFAPTEKSARVTLTNLLPFCFLRFHESVTRNVEPGCTQPFGTPKVIEAPGTLETTLRVAGEPDPAGGGVPGPGEGVQAPGGTSITSSA